MLKLCQLIQALCDAWMLNCAPFWVALTVPFATLIPIGFATAAWPKIPQHKPVTKPPVITGEKDFGLSFAGSVMRLFGLYPASMARIVSFGEGFRCDNCV